MKKLIKFLAVIMATILFAGCFIGCKDKKDGAIEYTLYDNAQYNMKLSFLENNITRLASTGPLASHFYNNTNTENYKSSITFAVQTQEDFDIVFETRFIAIDFSREMLVIRIFTSITAGSPVIINSVFVKNNVLIVDWGRKNTNNGPQAPNTSIPTHRAIAIKVPSGNYNSIVFE